MIYDLNISTSNRKIRIATHGHGIWERSFVNDPLSINDIETRINSFNIYPNPASEKLTISIDTNKDYNNIKLEMYSILGQKVQSIFIGNLHQGNNSFTLNSINKYTAGTYFITLTVKGTFKASKIAIIK